MEKEKILQLVATALGDARQTTVIVLTTDHVLTDQETYALWWRKAQALSRQGFRIAVSDFLEEHASTYDRLQKHDIADFFMNDRILRKISPKNE